MTNIYDTLKLSATEVLTAHGLLDKTIRIKARTLTPQEAIGNPDSDDFPIQKGKERLMQAELNGAFGQAFTDRFGNYAGTMAEILAMPLTDNYRRAVFVAALNASLRHLKLVSNTVHCRDKGPQTCAEALCDYIDSRYGNVKITQIGFQPMMVKSLSARFSIRVLDMDPDNIDCNKYGTIIESPKYTASAITWADVLLVTGTTIVNGTLPAFLGNKPVIFYGTTIAGAALLMGWERFCASST